MTRRLRGAAAGERGLSIIEVSIAAAILATVMAIVLQGMSTMEKQVASTAQRIENLSEARSAMAGLTKAVRTAARISPTESPFVQAGDFDVTFHANLHNPSGPVKVRFYVDAQRRLVRVLTPPDAGSAPNWTYTGAPTARVFANHVSTSGSALFTYVDAMGATMTPPPGGDAAGLRRIDAVSVKVAVQKDDNGKVPASVIESLVRLPNVDYNPLATPAP